MGKEVVVAPWSIIVTLVFCGVRRDQIHKTLTVPPSSLHLYTRLHPYLSGEIDHVQFPTNRSPTASFECINNSTPLHLSSLASYTVHSSPSPSFSSQPCVYLDGFPCRNFWIWMRNSKMRFQLPCSPAMSCRLLLSVRSDDEHQRCRLLLHYWVVVIF